MLGHIEGGLDTIGCQNRLATVSDAIDPGASNTVTFEKALKLDLAASPFEFLKERRLVRWEFTIFFC